VLLRGAKGRQHQSEDCCAKCWMRQSHTRRTLLLWDHLNRALHAYPRMYGANILIGARLGTCDADARSFQGRPRQPGPVQGGLQDARTRGRAVLLI